MYSPYVISHQVNPLRDTIDFYLSNPSHAAQIAEQGHQTIQNYTREHWAKRIIEIYEQILKIFPKSKSTLEKKERLLDYITKSA